MNNDIHFWKKTVVTKRSIEVFKYALSAEVKTDRCKRCKPTTEAQAACNLNQARQRLSWLIAENFGIGDGYITLTYEGEEPTEDEAKAVLSKWLRFMREMYKAYGYELRYISKTERGNESDRIHHHILLNFCPDLDDILYDSWYYGGYSITTVQENEGYHKALATYFTTPKGSSPAMKQLYNCSHNLSKPQISIKEITETEFQEAPESEVNGGKLIESSFQSSADCFGNPYCCYYYKLNSLSRSAFKELRRQKKTQGKNLYCAGFDENGVLRCVVERSKSGAKCSKTQQKKRKNAAKKARRKSRRK